MEIIKSVALFVLAGLCEIGGGYLIWLWLRAGKSCWLGAAGAVLLVVYGVIPTLQPATFGRTYAAYCGVFIALSLIWAWQVDKVMPDKFDCIGAVVALIGVAIIFYTPRN